MMDQQVLTADRAWRQQNNIKMALRKFDRQDGRSMELAQDRVE
jgi:hypothetical protein